MERLSAPDGSTFRLRAMRATDGDLEAFQRCFEANQMPRAADLVRWQFAEPPVGSVYVDFAVDDRADGETVAAIYAVVPFAASLGGRDCVAAQSLDTLTDARYRGRGLFVALAKRTYARLAEAGVAFVFGFPNENSMHGFFERLEWQSLDPVPMLFRPLRVGYVLSRLGLPARVAALAGEARLPLPRVRLPRGCKIREVADFDASFDALWERFAAGIGVCLRRDAAYLRWRFRRPGAKYRVWAVDGERGTCGFVATALVAAPRVTAGYVMELIYEPERRDVGAALLAHALRELERSGAEVALASNFGHSPNHPAYRRAGFLSLPWRLRSEKIYFGVRALAAREGELLRARKSWYVSCCDFDTQ